MRRHALDGDVILETRHAVGRHVATVGDREYVHLVIKPGGGIDAHVLPHPIEFFVVAGEGEARVDGERIEVGAGDLLIVPAGVERAWTNTDEVRLVLLGVKTVPTLAAH
ncbi:MAG: cupin domain-containing protein [Candidatus Krumholzibacteriia bacterium]